MNFAIESAHHIFLTSDVNQDNKSKRSTHELERVGVIEFIQDPEQLTYRFLIDINESSSQLRIQRELILKPQGMMKKNQDTSDSSYIDQAYQVSWRELTQEKHGFFSSAKEQFSYGEAKVFRKKTDFKAKVELTNKQPKNDYISTAKSKDMVPIMDQS